jgi:hypothetical protein
MDAQLTSVLRHRSDKLPACLPRQN